MATKNIVVLIHGLFGDLKSWGDTDQFLQAALPEWEVVKFVYQTKKLGINPSIKEIAIQLDDWLTSEYPGADLILAGHSMGGLVAKEYILDYLRRAKRKELRVNALFLVAVPNNGAEAASIAKNLPIINSIQIRENQPPKRRWWPIGRSRIEETFVEHQQLEFSTRVNSTDKSHGMQGKASLDVYVYYAIHDRIVHPRSARGLHSHPVPLVGDHTSVVKPSSPDDRLVRSMIQVIQGVPVEESLSPTGALPTRTIHYVDPILSFNAHYAAFEQSLRQAAYVAGLSLRHHVPKDELPEATLQLLIRLFDNVQPGEYIIVTPRGFAKIADEVMRLLSNKKDSVKIVFVDQEPPIGFMRLPNVSYVGPDNWLVGSLAAIALEVHLMSIELKTEQVLTLDGPGGSRRCQGFVDTATAVFPHRSVEAIPIPDKDRFDTIRVIRGIVRGKPAVAGFFAGNDETAAAIIDAIDKYQHSGVVVGCDGTREMRDLAVRGGTPLVDTIRTQPRLQAKEVIRLCQDGEIGKKHFKLPKVERYRFETRELISRNAKLSAWWPDGRDEWLPDFSGADRDQ